MTRQILFDKKGDSSPKKERPKSEKKEQATDPKGSPKAKKTTKANSGDLIAWLKGHDLIKIRTLCLKAGIDPGSFHRWMNVTKEIPAAAIEKIIPILIDYGFNVGVYPNLGII